MAEDLHEERERHALWREWEIAEHEFAAIFRHGRSILQNDMEYTKDELIGYLKEMKSILDRHPYSVIASLVRRTSKLVESRYTNESNDNR